MLQSLSHILINENFPGEYHQQVMKNSLFIKYSLFIWNRIMNTKLFIITVVLKRVVNINPCGTLQCSLYTTFCIAPLKLISQTQLCYSLRINNESSCIRNYFVIQVYKKKYSSVHHPACIFVC